MLKSAVISHFGSKAKVAKALGIGRAAVGKWGVLTPPDRAIQLQKLTEGSLPFRLSAYDGVDTPLLRILRLLKDFQLVDCYSAHSLTRKAAACQPSDIR